MAKVIVDMCLILIINMISLKKMPRHLIKHSSDLMMLPERFHSHRKTLSGQPQSTTKDLNGISRQTGKSLFPRHEMSRSTIVAHYCRQELL